MFVGAENGVLALLVAELKKNYDIVARLDAVFQGHKAEGHRNVR
jgi:hypothetical protein